MMGKKPKYYVTNSWVNSEWFIVAQVSNNMIIAHIPDETIAKLFADFLNQLPGKQQPNRKRRAIYPNLSKKRGSDNH